MGKMQYYTHENMRMEIVYHLKSTQEKEYIIRGIRQMYPFEVSTNKDRSVAKELRVHHQLCKTIADPILNRAQKQMRDEEIESNNTSTKDEEARKS